MNLTQHGHTFTVTTEHDLLVLLNLLQGGGLAHEAAVMRYGLKVAA